MQGLLEGKVAVITGAGSGVGRAAVKLWTEHGAKVIAADIDLPSAEESVRLAGAPQGQAKAFGCGYGKRVSSGIAPSFSKRYVRSASPIMWQWMQEGTIFPASSSVSLYLAASDG